MKENQVVTSDELVNVYFTKSADAWNTLYHNLKYTFVYSKDAHWLVDGKFDINHLIHNQLGGVFLVLPGKKFKYTCPSHLHHSEYEASNTLNGNFHQTVAHELEMLLYKKGVSFNYEQIKVLKRLIKICFEVIREESNYRELSYGVLRAAEDTLSYRMWAFQSEKQKKINAKLLKSVYKKVMKLTMDDFRAVSS